MRLETVWIVVLASVYIGGWIGTVAFYNRTDEPETVAQRKTVRPWVVALCSLLWPILLMWGILYHALEFVGRVARKKGE